MGGNQVWRILAAAVSSLLVTPARANIPVPPVNPLPLRDESGQGTARLQIATCWSQWGIPGQEVQGANLRRDADPSPLIIGEYSLGKHVGIGGWWNHITGSDHQTGRMDLPPKVADFDLIFWDVHVRYYLRNDWRASSSVQLGVNTLHFDVRPVKKVREMGGRGTLGSFRSPNFWVSRTQRVRGRSDPRSRHPVDVYISVGYIPSPGFGNANIIFGGSIGLSRTFSLGGSIWLNDLENISPRTTVGLVGTF